MDSRRVFTFLGARLNAGQAAVLVTIIAVEGSSMRSPGTHMGVAQDGSFEGSLSGGCIEQAVVAEALDVLGSAAPLGRVVRFGSGSPYIDIKLPCGGGLDIHFMPLHGTQLVAASLRAIEQRTPFSLELALDASQANFVPHWRETAVSAAAGSVVIGHWPEPRLLIIGHGSSVVSLAKLARQMDLTVEVLSPDLDVLAALDALDITSKQLMTPADTTAVCSDRWTAIIFLFHDHDWETALMTRAAALPRFYLGAMGGQRAHAARIAHLRKAGVSEQDTACVHGPIGLFHSSRDPDTLALSTLGQVIEIYHRTDFGQQVG